MKVTRDMVDKDLRGRYAAGRMLAAFFHTRRLSPLVLGFIGRAALGKNTRGLVCQQLYVPSRNGGAPIRVRVYRPAAATGPLPVMLYLHGGGYFLGVPEHFGSIIRDFIKTVPCILLAPVYRKAVQAPYAAAFNDSYDTRPWKRDHAVYIG